MHIKMKETRRGSADGHEIGLYHEGCIYEVPDTMGKRFVQAGWAEWVQADETPRPELGGSALTVAGVAAQFNKVFRPQPTRGTAPQNPSTYTAVNTGMSVQIIERE